MIGADTEETLAYLEQKAVKAASFRQWKLAIEINRQILKINPANTAGLNRLGKAFWENGRKNEAERFFKKTLEIDPHNLIAFKNLERLKKTKNLSPFSKEPPSKNTAIFLEEPGKTKIVKLIRLASHQILCEHGCADEVFLRPRNRLINIINRKGTYLGCLPEDLSLRLTKLIKGGNRYEAFIRHVDAKNLHLFMKEIKRSAHLRNTPSFLSFGFWLTVQIRSFA